MSQSVEVEKSGNQSACQATGLAILLSKVEQEGNRDLLKLLHKFDLAIF
jgi:hypothetical protein